MEKLIRERFKPKKEKMSAQALIDANIWRAADAQRKKDNVTWAELIESCFQFYVEQTKAIK